jgi:hypothetical protein
MDTGLAPVARNIACANADPERTLPPSASVAATRASRWSDVNRGIANAARIPRIVITTTNSMSVKPPCLTAALIAKLSMRDTANLGQQLIDKTHAAP